MRDWSRRAVVCLAVVSQMRSIHREQRAVLALQLRYLYYRIQSNPDQKPDRKPDMSEAAAAAMKDVLIEVGSTSWEPLKALLVKGASSSALVWRASIRKRLGTRPPRS